MVASLAIGHYRMYLVLNVVCLFITFDDHEDKPAAHCAFAENVGSAIRRRVRQH